MSKEAARSSFICCGGRCGPAVEAAAAKVDALDAEGAISLYRQALTAAPRCIHALNGLGDVLLGSGDSEGARAALRESVLLAPDGQADRYMNLGQLEEGADALLFLDRGVSILRTERLAIGQSAGGAGEESQRQWVGATHALASALCSVAEVYLTDACDEYNAEERCEAAANEAVELVSALSVQTLAEPYVTCASLRLSQSRPEEAVPLIDRALAIIHAADEAALPPFDVRKNCAKLLMEVERAGEAMELLQALRMEADDHLEVWYLTCCAALQEGEPAYALEEASAACDFAQSERCPPDEREWLEQLMEIREEASAACAGADS
jgi:predicted Zn-dependent protease